VGNPSRREAADPALRRCSASLRPRGHHVCAVEATYLVRTPSCEHSACGEHVSTLLLVLTQVSPVALLECITCGQAALARDIRVDPLG
jgi:hypothetical protein